VSFTVRPADCPEIEQGDPGEVALENALRKARVAQKLGMEAGGGAEVVLGCDTLVALEGTIYGKPRDEQEARATLQALSGTTHEVISGVAVLLGGAGRTATDRSQGGQRTALARTAVTFRTLDEELLDWSLASGEWRGRAGGYAIQGTGAALIRKIEGDYENVVGLPLASLLDIYPELLFACK
jgi:septum formation protein